MSQSDGGTRSFTESGSDLPVDQALLLDETCDAFEAKWRAGGKPDIRAAVLELPETLRPVALKELIQVDVYYRRQRGETPTVSDYTNHFPESVPSWLALVVGVVASNSQTATATGDQT